MQLLAQKGHQGGETLPLCQLTCGSVGGRSRKQSEFIELDQLLRVRGGGNHHGSDPDRQGRGLSGCTAR